MGKGKTHIRGSWQAVRRQLQEQVRENPEF